MEITAAGWSACAATFSALTAWLTWRIHQSNQIESVRPELVVEDWNASPLDDEGCMDVSVPRIANHGKGTAYHVQLTFPVSDSREPVEARVTRRIAMIASGKCFELNESLPIDVSSIPRFDTWNSGSIVVRLSFQDCFRRHYSTDYTIFVCREARDQFSCGLEALGPNASVDFRRTDVAPTAFDIIKGVLLAPIALVLFGLWLASSFGRDVFRKTRRRISRQPPSPKLPVPSRT